MLLETETRKKKDRVSTMIFKKVKNQSAFFSHSFSIPSLVACTFTPFQQINRSISQKSKAMMRQLQFSRVVDDRNVVDVVVEIKQGAIQDKSIEIIGVVVETEWTCMAQERAM